MGQVCDAKTEIFTTIKKNKKSYALLMEFATHLLKRKDFYNKIKILYPLWGVQPNLKNQKA